MSTPSDLSAEFGGRAEEILREGRFRNFVAQSKSRDVLRELQIPESEWPTFTPALDDDLAYGAQTLLYLGLQMKAGAADTNEADTYLTRGAELLENLYARADDINSDPERVCQRFTAALAYYMAGHFARAFVLVRDVEARTPLPRFLRPLRHLLLKEFRPLQATVLDHLFQPDYGDAEIAAAVTDGRLDEDQALCRVLEATLYRILSHFLEYAKAGDEDLLSTAEGLAESAIDVSIAHRFADWWWYFSCVRIMLATFRRHSLWTNLAPLLDRPQTAALARLYIHANLRLDLPVTELWPSQVTAIPRVLSDASGKNACIRMPTSAGKTKIAEIAILNHFAVGGADSAFKCVYVAPFRSLAVEIEHTLRQALRPVGLQVSELYGGFELTATDTLIIERTHVLVATPEKFDAFMRFSPKLAEQIRLVILDEGHIISPPNFRALRKARGLKYEVFLQRLVNRCERTGARTVFLSAVMPNADQFAHWITGEENGLVSSEWRPSRLMLGEAVWTGSSIDLEFTHIDHQPLGHHCVVHGFVTQRGAEDLPDKRRTKPFPGNADEALAVTALKFARHKMTMVFVARKTSAEPLGRTLLKCFAMNQKMGASAQDTGVLGVEPRYEREVNRCIDLIREHMGGDNEHVEFLKAGFVVHHSRLPQPVRLALERLVRSGAIKLVVATTTLAQGVNFPIHTVLVHSLYHGQDDPVTPMDFWNICGRAGRGMQENEGRILFLVKQSFDEWQKAKSKKFKRCARSWQLDCWKKWCEEQRERRAVYLDQYGNYQVKSGLLVLIRRVVRLWNDQHGSVNLAQLCEALANNALDMFAPSAEVDLEDVLSTLDGLLIAMTEETDADEITPDTFQSLLCRSLLHLQLATPQQRHGVNRLFAARVSFIRRRHPDPQKRRQFYQLGLPLRDCEFIESERDKLLGLYLAAEHYDTWSVHERANHLAEIGGILFSLSEVAPAIQVPYTWNRILELWLSGGTPADILADPEVAKEKLTAHDLNHWIDDAFSYRLPWGLNSLGNYLRQYAETTGHTWPDVCDYYASFVKYGVHEPVVCWLLALGIPSRALAARVAALIDEKPASPKKLVRWLRRTGMTVLRETGLGTADLDSLKSVIRRQDQSVNAPKEQAMTVRIVRADLATAAPTPGTRLLLQRGESPNYYTLLTLGGALVCSFRLESEQLSAFMAQPELVIVEAAEPRSSEPGTKLCIRIARI